MRDSKVVDWKSVREEVIKLNPTLGEALDQLPGVNKFKLIKASYGFGDILEHHGEFYLNIKNQNLRYSDGTVPDDIRQLLSYPWKTAPFGICLKNCFEMVIDLPSHSIPVKMVKPGGTIALFSLFDKASFSNMMRGAYTVRAGARSLCLLPKISHQQYNDRLARRFGAREHLCPKTLSEQWGLFHEMTQSENFHSDWTADFLFFTKDFSDHIEQDVHLNNTLLSTMLHNSSFARNQAMFDLVWSIFSENLPSATRNSPVIVETIRHLVKIAMRQSPGYVPASSDKSGPIRALTDAILNVYKIRYYLPVFMRPQHFDGVNPIYYSLHKHTFLHTIPQRSNANRTIFEMETIQELLTQFRDMVLQDKFPFPIQDTTLYEAFQKVEFEFYHPHGNAPLNNDIDSIADDDPRFLKMVNQFKTRPDLTFPDHSIFFNGCIRIRPTKKPGSQSPNAMKAFLMPMRKHIGEER